MVLGTNVGVARSWCRGVVHLASSLVGMADDLRIDFFEPYRPGATDRWTGDFPRRRIASRTAALVDANDAELRTSPTKWLLPKVLHSDNTATFVDLYRIRSDRWPYFSRQGAVTPLDAMLAIDDDDGLADVTHFAFFPGNIVMGIYNHFGPRHPDLSRYLLDRLGVDVDLRPVPRDDMMETLNSAATVKKFHLRFASQQGDILRSSGGDFARDAARLATEMPQTDVEITLTVRGSEQTGSTANRIKRAASDLLTGARPALKAASVQIGDDDDYGRAMLNLLEDDIVLSRPVPLHIQNKRYIGEADAMEVLRAAYRTMSGELARTLGDLVEEASSEADEVRLPPLPDDAAA